MCLESATKMARHKDFVLSSALATTTENAENTVLDCSAGASAFHHVQLRNNGLWRGHIEWQKRYWTTSPYKDCEAAAKAADMCVVIPGVLFPGCTLQVATSHKALCSIHFAKRSLRASL